MEDAARVLVVVGAAYLVLLAALVAAGRGPLARELATLVPNLVALFGGLVRDPAVPLGAKAVLAVAIVWIASPIDLVPEFIPIAGPLDDAIVAALALRVVLRSTDRETVGRHWRGSPEMLARLLRLAGG
ncbi:MAG TPA: DUF1232 domain-containing protein [Candidatus Limnocylindria bacterium]|nr:DUF1232 domain-containing protein [Candidatus Limnocylindria bacterium]